ncbi:hypothetical protein OR16_38669 [Cupriavidus basilensis OR16]|uniref:Uncharacterized protein n=1 Tax=Cupriavidus basilensis OR16 TaxID=1127483 RepID=H1SH38_9BURK|nr:hypothetical protein OR16_38669 [Cupriavidus basilensis OR16]
MGSILVCPALPAPDPSTQQGFRHGQALPGRRRLARVREPSPLLASTTVWRSARAPKGAALNQPRNIRGHA